VQKNRGVTLLEVTVSAGLLSMIGIAATTALRFSTDRIEQSQIRRKMVAEAEIELNTIKALANAGTLVAGVRPSRTISLGPGRTGTIEATVFAPAVGSTVYGSQITGTFNMGTPGQTGSFTINSGHTSDRRPRAIGVKFAPNSISAPGTGQFFGDVPSAYWNMSRNGSITSAVSDDGQATTLNCSTSLTNVVDLTSNLPTGSSAPGDNFAFIARGAVWSSGVTTNTLTLSGIPFTRYDLILYLQVPDIGTLGTGTVQLGGGSLVTIPLNDVLTDPPRVGFVTSQNTFYFSNLTGATQTVNLAGTVAVPPLHAFQVVERK
jgi:hypothetical protein